MSAYLQTKFVSALFSCICPSILFSRPYVTGKVTGYFMIESYYHILLLSTLFFIKVTDYVTGYFLIAILSYDCYTNIII